MRKNKKSSRSRRNLAILYILIFIVVAFFVYWMIKHQRQKPPTKPNPSPETSETKNSSPPTNHPTLTTSESEDSNPQTPVQNEDAHPNDSTTLTGAITYLSKNQDKLTVRVNIDQYLSGGTCVLKLATAGHTPLAYQAPIVSSASTATNHPTLTTSESEDSNPQTPVQNEDAHPNDSTTLTGAITYLSKNQDKLTVRVNIDQYLSGGTCVLKLATAGHTPLAYQAPIVSSASTATCQGFDIPLSDLTPATWQVSIELFSGDRTGLITGEVTI